MNDLIELIDHVHTLTPSGTIFLVCLAALAVVWKALDVVAKSQAKKLPRKNP